MSKKYAYPVQMASIKRDDWRLQDFIKKGFTEKDLQKAEGKLWKQIEGIANKVKIPPRESANFPRSKLLGYGLEWAVYELASSEDVVKIPAGIFKEVSEKKYLENVEIAYEVCKKYLKDLVIDTDFKRINTKDGKLNTIKQRKIMGDEISFIEPSNLKPDLKNLLTSMGEALLMMLKEKQWILDFHLWRREENGKKGWNIWNLFIEKDRPVVFDFTVYYDV